MYQPPLNREDRPEVMHQLIREQPLGLLISAGAQGLLANPIPFVLHAGEEHPAVLECHMAIANPQWRDLVDGAEVLIVFQGPQAYVTPSWYPAKREHGKTVPTWNYVVVQARGRAYAENGHEWLMRHLNDLTDHNEAPLEEPWQVSDAPESYVEGMLKGIKGVRIEVSSMAGKWKLSQNRSRADREGVVHGLGAQGGEAAHVAAIMAEQLTQLDSDS